MPRTLVFLQMSASDASLVSFLQSELLLLSNEIKKKYPEIKESIESVFQLIRKIRDDPERPNAAEVFAQTELILQPIVLSCRTGNAKVVAIAINCLQKLVLFQAFPRECLGSVFGVLESTVEASGEVQLKALQCLSPLMVNYENIYGAELFKLFSIAFKLQESKTQMVNNASSAIIRQMIITLFERVSDEQEGGRGKDVNDINESNRNNKRHTEDALSILNDICVKLTDGDQPVSLDLSKIDKPFALDLIESIMSNHGSVFRSEPAFADVIRDRICPLIVECFEDGFSGGNRGDFARICRLWRLSQLITTEFSDILTDNVTIFVAFWVRILRDAKSTPWERAMVLEILKVIMSSSLVFESVYSICDGPAKSTQLMKDLLEATLELMSDILATNDGLIADQRNAVLTQFDKATPPPISANYLLLLAYESFNTWTFNLLQTVRGLTTDKQTGWLSAIKNFDAFRDRDMQMAAELLKFTGNRLSAVLILLAAQSCEAFARLLCLFAVFEMRSELDGLLHALLPLTLPESLYLDPFTPLNAQLSLSGGNALLMTMLLSVGKELAELLENAWIPITRIEHAVAQMSLLRERKIVVLPFEIDPLLVLEESLMIQTKLLSEKAFTCVVQATSSLIQEGFGRESVSNPTSLLLLLKRQQSLISLSFASRVLIEDDDALAWDCALSTAITVASSRDSSLRIFATQCASSAAVELFVKHCPVAKMKSSKMLQLRCLEPMAKIAGSSVWPDVHRLLLESILSFVEAFGEALTPEAWEKVLLVGREGLSRVTELAANNSNALEGDELVKECGSVTGAAFILYRGVHDLIKYISSNNMVSLSLVTIDVLVDLMAILGGIKLTGEVNIPLNAVRYLWDVSDHLASFRGERHVEAFPSWLRVLKHLSSLGLDSRPELRNSAVQTMLRTASMNGAALKSESQWKSVFDDLIFPFLTALRRDSAAANSLNAAANGFNHFSRDSVAKQWHETESAALTGLTQLIIGHQSVLGKFSEWKHFWQSSLDAYKAYICDDGAEELVTVSVNSLLALSGGVESGHAELFDTWQSIQLKSDKRIPFCQDSLLKFAKISLNTLQKLDFNAEIAQNTLESLTSILQYATPNDAVRDCDGPSELQRFFCTSLLDELKALCSKNPNTLSLLVKEVATWIRLARGSPESPFCFAFGYPSLRSRQSTASSTKSHNAKTEVNSSVEYTFIGMTSLLLPRTPQLINESVSIDALEALFMAYGKYLRAKYKSPGSGRLERPLWFSALEAFHSTYAVLDATQKAALWPVCLDEMGAALLAAKNMFTPQMQDVDEEVDCRWFEFMRVALIPDLEEQKLNDLVLVLVQIARIVKLPLEEGNESDEYTEVEEADFKFPSGIRSLPVAVKERLCFGAYDLLFQLAAKDNYDFALHQISSLTAAHLKAFIADRRILGPRFPLSRLRLLELSGLLKGSLSVTGTEHLRPLAELIVDVEGEPKDVLRDCKKIMRRLNGFSVVEEDEEEDSPVITTTNTNSVASPVLDAEETPILLPEERSVSPVSKKSFSETVLNNFRSMDLFNESTE